MTSIGSYAFEDTPWYDNQPDGLIYVGKVVYKYKGTMPKGTQIDIEDGTIEIAGSAFSYCSNLTSITIPNSVTNIGGWAFISCTGLTSIIIPNSVTNIGNSAFEDCRNLTSIIIPNNVTSIGFRPFIGCYFTSNSFVNNSSITADWGAIICDEETPDGLLIKDNIVVKCRTWATSATIPYGITSIDYKAFERCQDLTSVTIPNSVLTIGDMAFSDCSNMTSIYIPEGVTSIGESTFAHCHGLTSVVIPSSVTRIESSTFYGCSSLTSFTIPRSITSIGSYVFCFCTGLKEIYCYAEETPDVDVRAFEYLDVSSIKLGVPDNSINAYKTHPVWGQFFIDTITGIDIPFKETENKDFIIYNLAGQRLQKMQKGINVVGGRKVLK